MRRIMRKTGARISDIFTLAKQVGTNALHFAHMVLAT
jgi:hypothetical protein